MTNHNAKFSFENAGIDYETRNRAIDLALQLSSTRIAFSDGTLDTKAILEDADALSQFLFDGSIPSE